MNIADAPVIMWGGLGSDTNDRYWTPLASMQKAIIGEVSLIKSNSGYAHWQDVADHINQHPNDKPKTLIGHSNGAYACLKVAANIKAKCNLIILDKTLKACPKAGNNIERLTEIWFGLSKVQYSDTFTGKAEFFDFRSESHIGGLSNQQVQRLVVDRANRWRNE